MSESSEELRRKYREALEAVHAAYREVQATCDGDYDHAGLALGKMSVAALDASFAIQALSRAAKES